MSTVNEPAMIGAGMAGTLMTPEEFLSADHWDDNYRYELINGVLIVAPPAGEGERGPNSLLDLNCGIIKSAIRKATPWITRSPNRMFESATPFVAPTA